MKITKLSLALAFVLATGCGSSKPKEETPPPAETPKVDKAQEAAENKAHADEAYADAVKAENAGEYVKARDGYLKTQSFVPDYKDTAARLKNLEDVCAVQQKVDAAPAGDPKRADLMVDLADALRKRGDLDRAMATAQKALEANPTFAGAHAEIATVDFEAGRVKEAIDHASKAIEADPGSGEGYYQLAFLHRTQQVEGADPSKALEFAQKAASLSKPNDWKAHELLAACYHDAGDMDKALASLKEAVKASGGLPRLQKKYESWGGKPDAPAPDKPADASAPKTDAPPAEAPKTDAPPAEAPKTDAPKADAPAEKPAEAPKSEMPPEKPAEAPPEQPKNDMGGGEQPK